MALIYLAYVLRAVRWAIFLQAHGAHQLPPADRAADLGFAALGLFGRAGEFARPYLIARKEKLTFTSQLAVWTVERFFDLGAVLVLMAGFLATEGRDAGPGAAAGACTAECSWRRAMPATSFRWSCGAGGAGASVLSAVSGPRDGRQWCCGRACMSFKQGFNTIHDARSFVQLVVVSLAMWLMIAGAYIEVLHAYPQIPVPCRASAGVQRVARMNTMKLEDVLLVMGSSMLGSVVQLPGGVGGSQLAVIGVLQSNLFSGEPYNITRELAVSCGIMLWLVTFMSVIPAGVLLARFEKISFLRLSEESSQEEEEVEAEAARRDTAEHVLLIQSR